VTLGGGSGGWRELVPYPRALRTYLCRHVLRSCGGEQVRIGRHRIGADRNALECIINVADGCICRLAQSKGITRRFVPLLSVRDLGRLK